VVEAGGVLVAAEGRELAREVELDALVDLAGAAVRRMRGDERAERVGVDLLLLRRGVRRHGGLLMAEHVQPLARVVGRIAASTAGERGQRAEEQEPAHCPPK